MKKYIYTLVIIFIFVSTPKVFADELLFGGGSYFSVGNVISITDTQSNLPYTSGTNANSTSSLGAMSITLPPDIITESAGVPYNYLHIQACVTGNNNQYFTITNSGTSNSYFISGEYSGVSLGTSGSVGSGNWICSNRLFVIPIGKWYHNPNSEMFTVSSYLNSKSTASYYSYFRIDRVFLASENLATTYSNQAELVNKLDSVNSSITNMQNNITNNQNTNTQNIINNQNQNQAQNHQDIINTQNKIDDLNDSVIDDTVNSNTGKSFFDNFSDNTHGLSGIITAPLNIIQQLINVNPTSCSALSTTYHNKTISMECGQIFWGHTGFSQFNVFYNMVVGGAFCYLIIKDLFLTIEKLKDPDNDKVEVMDL